VVRLQNGQVFVLGETISADLYDPAADQFSASGGLNLARGGNTATTLPSGTVLIAGGVDSLGLEQDSAELFDPQTGRASWLSGRMTAARTGHSASPLASGKVVLAGGADKPEGELFDPTSQTFVATQGQLTPGRYAHAAARLSSGKVLLAGGLSTDDGSAIADLTVYDPATDAFTPGPAMATARTGHTVTELASGKLLILGGSLNKVSLDTAEIYDPATSTVTPVTATLGHKRSGHSATLLADGRVLIVGGKDYVTPDSFILVPEVEVFDPAQQTFSLLPASVVDARGDHAAVRLLDGRILFAGGYTLSARGVGGSAEVFVPASSAFVAVQPMHVGRLLPAAALLADGRALVMGGMDEAGSIQPGMEWFVP
jgi:N-acetylneuraminic acid mutarotase